MLQGLQTDLDPGQGGGDGDVRGVEVERELVRTRRETEDEIAGL